MHAAMRSCITLLAALTAAVPARAQRGFPITGVFGDLHWVPEAGDIVGTEVIVVRTAGAYRVIFQEGLGEPGPVDTVPASIRGDSLFFDLPANPTWRIPARSFRGQIAPKQLRGRFAGHSDELVLPRRARSARRG